MFFDAKDALFVDLIFLVNVIHLVLIGFTIIFEVLQNMFTQSSNFCRPFGVLDIRITSSAYMRQDMKEPLGSSTDDEFISSRSNSKLLIKMLKRMGPSGKPCLTPFSHLKKFVVLSLNFY